MVSGTDLEITDIAESIPYVLVNAMRGGEANVVRGLQGMSGAVRWQIVNPAIHLIELIIDARREDGIVYSGLLEDIMVSTRGDEIIDDFIEWGLLEPQLDGDGNGIFVAPDIWDTFINTLDEVAPDMGLQSLGELLGICSFVRHRDRRRQWQGALKKYIPVKAVAVHARGQDGSVSESDARREFTRHSSWDADRRWLDLKYGDLQRVTSLRFCSDWTDPLILNPDVLTALDRVIGRTNELFRERGLGV
ncbi:MAG: hypothetical protein ACOC6R_01355 [Chloroflexota bacterium]